MIAMTYKDLAKELGLSGDFFGGICRGDVKVELFLEVMNKYPELFDLEEAQDSVTTGRILDVVHPDDILQIYVVSDDRLDKRVAIEGVFSKHQEVILELGKSDCSEISFNSIWWN